MIKPAPLSPAREAQIVALMVDYEHLDEHSANQLPPSGIEARWALRDAYAALLHAREQLADAYTRIEDTCDQQCRCEECAESKIHSWKVLARLAAWTRARRAGTGHAEGWLACADPELALEQRATRAEEEAPAS